MRLIDWLMRHIPSKWAYKDDEIDKKAEEIEHRILAAAREERYEKSHTAPDR